MKPQCGIFDFMLPASIWDVGLPARHLGFHAWLALDGARAEALASERRVGRKNTEEGKGKKAD